MAVLALDRDGNDAGHSRTPPAVVLDHLRAEPSRPLDPNHPGRFATDTVTKRNSSRMSRNVTGCVMFYMTRHKWHSVT